MKSCQAVLLVDSFSTVAHRDCNGYLPNICDANGLGPQRPGILPRAPTLATMSLPTAMTACFVTLLSLHDVARIPHLGSPSLNMQRHCIRQ